MKSLSPLVMIALVASIMVAHHARATPAQDITRAVAVAGGSDNFLGAFGSVLARVKSRQRPDYVAAAMSLRRDLQSEILRTALDLTLSSNSPARQAELIAIVRAAVRAATGDLTAILASAIEAFSDQRGAIESAASLAVPGQASALRTIALHSGFSHESPSASDTAFGEKRNLQGPGREGGNGDDQTDVRSPEKPPRES